MKKRVISILLIAAMIALMLPVTASAAVAAPECLYVGGICVVDGGVITGNALPSGVSYNHTTATLTLENADISGIPSGYDQAEYANGIFAYSADELNIVLKGSNKITAATSEGDSSIITCSGIQAQSVDNVNFFGNGSLVIDTVSADQVMGISISDGAAIFNGGNISMNIADAVDNYGLAAGYGITVNNGTALNIALAESSQWSCGIWNVWDTIDVKGGKITINSEGSLGACAGICGESDIIIEGGEIIVNAGDAYIASYAIDGSSAINITGGIVRADSGDAKCESSALNSFAGDVTISGNAQVYATSGNVVNTMTNSVSDNFKVANSVAINGQNVSISGSCYVEAACGATVFTDILLENATSNKCMPIYAVGSKNIANDRGIIKFGNSVSDYSEKTVDDITADDLDNAKYFSIGVRNDNVNAGAGGTGITLYGPYIYENDEKVMKTEAEAKGTFEYGKSAYYLIIDDTDVVSTVLYDNDYVEDMKVTAAYSIGGDLTDKVSIVKKQIDTEALTDEGKAFDCAKKIDTNCGNGDGYYYFVEICTKEKKTTSFADVIGVFEFNRKADSKKGIAKIKDCRLDFNFELFYPNNWEVEGKVTTDRADLEWDTMYALKFDNDDEVELSFGSANGGNNEGTFTVDISGQGKLLLSYSTEPVEAIAKLNEGAKMDFITFSGVSGIGVKFNRSGEFAYEMDNGTHAYRVVGEKLEPISGLTVDNGEFKFNTSKLEAYVFADRELVSPAA